MSRPRIDFTESTPAILGGGSHRRSHPGLIIDGNLVALFDDAATCRDVAAALARVFELEAVVRECVIDPELRFDMGAALLARARAALATDGDHE